MNGWMDAERKVENYELNEMNGWMEKGSLKTNN